VQTGTQKIGHSIEINVHINEAVLRTLQVLDGLTAELIAVSQYFSGGCKELIRLLRNVADAALQGKGGAQWRLQLNETAM